MKVLTFDNYCKLMDLLIICVEDLRKNKFSKKEIDRWLSKSHIGVFTKRFIKDKSSIIAGLIHSKVPSIAVANQIIKEHYYYCPVFYSYKNSLYSSQKYFYHQYKKQLKRNEQ